MTKSVCLTRPIGRRGFIKLTTAAAVMGASRFSWAKEVEGVLAPSAPPDDRELNDYLVAEISTSALKSNLDLVRRQLKPRTKLCVVSKADCYGHTWAACQDMIVQNADWVAVATPGEALTVRQSGCRLPLLLLMATGFSSLMARARLRRLIAEDVTLTVASPSDVVAISSVASQLGRPAKVHIKIDTGMTRSGVLADKAPALVHVARCQNCVALTGLYTHFSTSESPDKIVAREQLSRFLAAVQASGDDAKGLMLHTANSAAMLDLPESHLDMVRVGSVVYGHQPADDVKNRLPLRAIMRVVGRLTQVKEVPAGSYVGYSRTYRFDRPARVGLVPIGYADGYNRSFSNRSVMKVAGRFVPVRGRVSMDQTILELTDVPDAKVGDPVEIISPDRDAPNSLDNLATLADTIYQEIVCRLGSRIRRVATT
jgi:alanine racemase